MFLFGGFKGQVRWPEGPSHLALNPPYLIFFVLFLFCFFVVCSFPLFVSNRQKALFSPRKGAFLFVFECIPFFFLCLFWPPLFQFLFLCLSLIFLYFFILVFFLLYFCSLCFSLSFLFFHLCFCCMRRTTSKH